MQHCLLQPTSTPPKLMLSTAARVQDEQRDLANTIRVSGSILLSTVSSFLDFFKMETGKTLDIVRAEIDLRVRTSCHGTCALHGLSMPSRE